MPPVEGELQPTLPLGDGAGALPAPAAAPVSAATVAPAAEPVAAAAPAVAAEAAPAAKVELTTDKPSLLETFEDGAKPEDGKTAAPAEVPPSDADKKPADGTASEKKPDAEAKTDVQAKSAEPVKPEPVAYEYALPETVTMDEALRGDFHTALDGFRADPAKGAQGLMDLHTREMTRYAESLLGEQHRAFNATRDEWAKKVLADEQIGGSGHATAMKAIARMRDRFVSSAKPGTERYQQDQKAFSEMLRVTGVGDNPVFLRLLHNVSHAYDEPGLPPENPRPPADNGRAPGSRRAVMYDNPRSHSNRQ